MAANDGPAPDRSSYTASDVVLEIWTIMDLPSQALQSLNLPGHDGPALPSSFKIGIIAQSSIALSALAAALAHATRSQTWPVPRVEVTQEGAVVEFKSSSLYLLDDRRPLLPWGVVGGLHSTSDGHVRIHDSFPNHRLGTLEMLGLPGTATKEDAAEKISRWASIDLETVGTAEGKLAIYAVRTYGQWDALPQSRAISNDPVLVQQISAGPLKGLPNTDGTKCLRGLRVLEMSRVIAAPLAGKTLAAHGADVLWVTSPNLPDLPALDRDYARGKRTIQLDIHDAADKERLIELLRTCDVFIQGYRPGSLASYGLSPQELTRINPGIICASMSAFGPLGPWSQRRGFDSLVQACSGMNASEAAHAGQGEAARPTPCQALDHAGGFLLAAGVAAAVHRRAAQGGAWRVDLSLAGVMKYLRSLGQYPGSSGFAAGGYGSPADVPEGYYETRETGFGLLKAIRHTPKIEGCEVGWEFMPKPLGSDEAEWL